MRLVFFCVVFSAAGAVGETPAAGLSPSKTSPAVVNALKCSSPKLNKKQWYARKKLKHAIKKKTWKSVVKHATTLAKAHETEPKNWYWKAVGEASLGKKKEALQSLMKLVGACNSERWRIGVRYESAFSSLRGDPLYAKAAMLGEKPTSLYGRLLAFGGKWEQQAQTCKREGAQLELMSPDPEKQVFKLLIEDRCDGAPIKLSFRGQWQLKEPGQLELTLPNKGKKETFVCNVAKCSALPGEDCVTCKVASYLELELLSVRR